jgi:hypothetical protein
MNEADRRMLRAAQAEPSAPPVLSSNPIKSQLQLLTECVLRLAGLVELDYPARLREIDAKVAKALAKRQRPFIAEVFERENHRILMGADGNLPNRPASVASGSVTFIDSGVPRCSIFLVQPLSEDAGHRLPAIMIEWDDTRPACDRIGARFEAYVREWIVAGRLYEAVLNKTRIQPDYDRSMAYPHYLHAARAKCDAAMLEKAGFRLLG